MTHVAIVGAGITGVTTADALLERGYHVTVFDRHRYPAMETSFANGGQLSASNAEVWNSTSTVLKGYGGFFTPSDSTGDIHKFTRGLAAACASRPFHPRRRNHRYRSIRGGLRRALVPGIDGWQCKSGRG